MQATHHTTLFTHPQTTDHSLPPTDNGSFFTLPQITPITQINSAALREDTAHRALNLKRVADALPAAQQLYRQLCCSHLYVNPRGSRAAV